MRNATKVVVILLALALLSGADERTEGKYGLKPGDLIPGAFHPFVVTGSWTNRFHCLVCEHGLNPTVMVFAREAPEEGQPLVDLLRGLDAAVAKRLAKDKLGAFAVVLSEGGRNALKSKLQGLAAAKDKELKHVALATAAPTTTAERPGGVSGPREPPARGARPVRAALLPEGRGSGRTAVPARDGRAGRARRTRRARTARRPVGGS